MNILVVGQGGREHAILDALHRSDSKPVLYCAPGNAGTAQIAENLPVEATDIEGLVQAAKNHHIDLTIIGPEVPLALGVVDRFREEGLFAFGPTRHCAQLESSKQFTKELLQKYGIPTARAQSFTDVSEALKALPGYALPVVIKADGLCAGKGVIIARAEEEAVRAVRQILAEKRFGEEGASILIEQYLEGYEASVFCFVSEGRLIPMPPAMDYKKIGEGDTGENTGGVGCIAPNPKLSETAKRSIYDEIIPVIEQALIKEDLRFTGLLFIGFLIENDVPYVLEFNTRFGDPETQALLPLMQSDAVEVFQKCMDGTLQKEDLLFSDQTALGVVLTADGYPGAYEKGQLLPDLSVFPDDIRIIHNGTGKRAKAYTANGGRVLTFITLQKDLETARERLYEELDAVSFSGLRYRSDIGQ